jgi:Zn-finger nucleic acid-binding protein
VELDGRVVTGGDAVLYWCAKCGGVWFHRGQMESTFPEAIKELAVPDDARPGDRACPTCSQAMSVFYYPQTFVEIDMCPQCLGLWLDAGELREIRIVRKGLRTEAREYADIPGAKGRVITLVNAALDWAMNW